MARRLRLVHINRNLIVFLIFLLVAIVFWFMQALKETATTQFTYSVKFVNVPKEVIFTSSVPKNISISVTGRGWNIIQYLAQHESRELQIDFGEVEKSRSKITLDNNLWRRLLTPELKGTLKYVGSTPTSLDIYYSNGASKRVPAVFNGKISTELQHLLCGVHVAPDSVEVVAPPYMLDSIKEVQTQYGTFDNLDDTLITMMPLHAATGIKVIPDSVRVEICVDLFTEKSLELPIYSENIPTNKVLRTFPSKAKATFHVSASLFNKISAEDFILVVNYEDTREGGDRLKIHLHSKPEGISHVRINPEYVEYVIEQAY